MREQVAAHVDHTTMRMVNDVYDSFIDPTTWPEAAEREKLAALFGFENPVRVEEGSTEASPRQTVTPALWARSGLARARSGEAGAGNRKPRRGKYRTGLRESGARDRARTGAPHVGNVSEEPEEPEESS